MEALLVILVVFLVLSWALALYRRHVEKICGR